MKIAILSGKGGTGKTFFATNLAYVSKPSCYIDADVEEPNGNLLLKPRIQYRREVYLKIPKVDQSKCTGCRICTDFCRYHALAYANGKLMVFPTLCHSCGACSFLCPEQALHDENHFIGYTEFGTVDNLKCYSGTLEPGHLSGVPIIETLLNQYDQSMEIAWIDCPPGIACQVIASIEHADFCLLVAEDSLFGLDNLKMAYELAKTFHKKSAVIINKCYEFNSVCDSYCKEEHLKVIGKIYYDPEMAHLGAEGHLAARESEKYYQIFVEIYHKILQEANHETVASS